MFDVITIGGATRDIFFDTTAGKTINDSRSESGKLLAFEYGAKIIPENVTFSYGGGACNTAVSFSRLGLKVAVHVNIGEEGTGSLVHEQLKKEGVNTSLVVRDPNAHTALSIIISYNKDHTMFLHRDANDNLVVKDFNKFKNCKWLYVSSLTGESAKILKDLPGFIEENNLKLAWNPGSDQIDLGYHKLKDVFKVTVILVVNRAEARELVEGKNIKANLDDEKDLLKELKSMGPEVAVITDGVNGSYAYDGNTNFFQPSVSRKTEETTGAGDAYGSTFVASRIHGMDIQGSMKMAATNAASVVSKTGSQNGLMRKEEVFNHVSQSKNEKSSK